MSVSPEPTPARRGGYDPAVIPFLKERDIALLGSDIAQEGGDIPGVSLPIHFFTLVALGVNLLDNLALEDLAAAVVVVGLHRPGRHAGAGQHLQRSLDHVGQIVSIEA